VEDKNKMKLYRYTLHVEAFGSNPDEALVRAMQKIGIENLEKLSGEIVYENVSASDYVIEGMGDVISQEVN
jgi:protein-tyrosine-phosphatase